MSAYGWGYLHGLEEGRRQGYAAANEEMAYLQRIAHTNVQALSRLHPWRVHVEQVRERQREAAARYAAMAKPWPEETTNERIT